MYLSLTLYFTSVSLITLTGSDSTLTPSHHCSMPAHPPSSLWCLRILIIVLIVFAESSGYGQGYSPKQKTYRVNVYTLRQNGAFDNALHRGSHR
ncbi:hypothetical protein BC835DRAFT_1401097 [Cytidiella melzeri]|nr:hypothetical protein BC835DRAFT_1401097 [Cytidiella melzeri]